MANKSATAVRAAASRPSARGDWFGHPPGLTILAATETWEAFSFFGMRTLLVYYMIGTLGIAQADASLIYGAFTGFAFFAPILGAVLCDRWLGRRRSVIIGGLLMALGHFLLMLPVLFVPALVLLALGAGLYLPALPCQIGALYAASDPRRSWAYNLYYMGMNGGALLAPLVCGTLGEFLGWHWGFGAAGVGMLIGIAIYLLGTRHLPPDPRPSRRRRGPGAAPPPLRPSALLPALWPMALVALCLILYRSASEQIGNTVAVWLASDVDRAVLGFEIPMTWFQAVNPILVITLTPLLMYRWSRLAARGRASSDLAKMAGGALMLGLGFALLVLASALAAGGRVSAAWVLGFILLLTLGELFMMPVALGLLNRLAPPGLMALGGAVWFATGSGGHVAAGLLGSQWSSMTPPPFFALMAGVSALAAAMIWALTRLGVVDARGVGA